MYCSAGINLLSPKAGILWLFGGVFVSLHLAASINAIFEVNHNKLQTKAVKI